MKKLIARIGCGNWKLCFVCYALRFCRKAFAIRRGNILWIVKPELPKVNIWSFDTKQKRICTKKNFEMNADATCGMFKNKLEEYIN